MRRLLAPLALCLAALQSAHCHPPDPLAASPFGFSCDNQTTYPLEAYCPQMAEAGIGWTRGFPTTGGTEPERGR